MVYPGMCFPIFKKKQFSSQPRGIFPYDTLLKDEAFLWDTDKYPNDMSCEKYIDTDL